MTATQIIGKKTARWLASHGLLINIDQYFDNRRALLAYVKAVYLNHNIYDMEIYEVEEVINSELEAFSEIVARRLLRGGSV